MKADVWMPLFIGDYLADTSHLSTEQHGAYLLLLMHEWRTGPLPDDDGALRRITGMEGAAWAKSKSLLRRFFTPSEEGTLIQARLEEERLKAVQKQAGAQAKALKAANARWGNHATSITQAFPGAVHEAVPDAMPGAMLEVCPSPSPTQKTKTRPAQAPFVLPQWVNKPAWEVFTEMRRKGRKPLTDHAKDLIVEELRKLCGPNDDGAAILDKSTRNGWADVYPLATSPTASAPVRVYTAPPAREA